MSLEFGLTITLFGVVCVFSALAVVAVACEILKRIFKEEKPGLTPPSAPAEAIPSKMEEMPEVEVTPPKSREFRIALNGKEHEMMVKDMGTVGKELGDVTPASKVERDVEIAVGDKGYKMKVEEVSGVLPVIEGGVQVKEEMVKEEVGEMINAPVQGTIVRIPVKVGDKVEKGNVLVVLEAMKMENDIESPVSGVVKAIKVSEGDTVNAGDLLVVLD